MSPTCTSTICLDLIDSAALQLKQQSITDEVVSDLFLILCKFWMSDCMFFFQPITISRNLSLIVWKQWNSLLGLTSGHTQDCSQKSTDHCDKRDEGKTVDRISQTQKTIVKSLMWSQWQAGSHDWDRGGGGHYSPFLTGEGPVHSDRHNHYEVCEEKKYISFFFLYQMFVSYKTIWNVPALDTINIVQSIIPWHLIIN